MHRVLRRLIALVYVAVMAGSCHFDREDLELSQTNRIAPLRVSSPEAWHLFDRSVSSGFTPDDKPVEVTLDRVEQIMAVRVRGPAPYRVDVRGRRGAHLGFNSINLSTLSPGWHTFTAEDLSSTDHVILTFRSVGEVAPVPEVELWGVSSDEHARSVDLTSQLLPAGFVTHDATTQQEIVEAGQCASFSIAIPRAPSQLRRAHLVYELQGAFRPFSLQRSLNGRAPFGGHWFAGDETPRTYSEPVDPDTLKLGTNDIRFCIPQGADRSVTISRVRVAGELARGTRLISEASLAPDQRDGSAAIDGDPSTALVVPPGARLLLSFDQLISPAALVVNEDVDPKRIQCLDVAGRPSLLTATRKGLSLIVAGGASACAALALDFETQVALDEIEVLGSGAAERVDWAQVVVTSPLEHFGNIAWIAGYIARPSGSTGAIRVDLGQQPSGTMSGAFGSLLERTHDLGAPWSIDVRARLPDGRELNRTIVLDRDRRDALATTKVDASTAPTLSANDESRFGKAGDSIVVRSHPAKTTAVRLGTEAGLEIPAGAVRKATDITARHLAAGALPPLDPGMINVTAPQGHGYEFLPHGQRFVKPVEVAIPFDPRLIPTGKIASDVYTYYYDNKVRRWRKLTRKTLDLGAHIAKSNTDHFTIMINAVLAAPTNPAPLSYDPTAIATIAAASPAANIDMLSPPQANPLGDANLTLPLQLPSGRGAYSPSLALGYSSASANGWLGVGWGLSLPKIEIDTRWGVPIYSNAEEPRYLLDGIALVPSDTNEGPTCVGGRRYVPRVEGSFAHILRCGTNPSDYWFEVRDSNGTRHVYGTLGGHATLTSVKARPDGPGEGIFRWQLHKVIDVHGNMTTFTYHVDEIGGVEPGRELYPAKIEYTATETNLSAPYQVEFTLDNGTRPDRVVNGRAGFKVVTRRLLRTIRVKFQNSTIREYVLTYKHGQFDKTVLADVRMYGLGGCAAAPDAFTTPSCAAFHLGKHQLEYFNEADEAEGFLPVETWDVIDDPEPLLGALTRGHTSTWSGGLSLDIAQGAAGAGVNVSGGTRSELGGFYDINGDGLPDLLFETDGLLNTTHFGRYNQSTSFNAFTPLGPPIVRLPSLGREKHRSWGIDASAGYQTKGKLGASISGGFSNATSRASRLISDLDGDGFIDFLDAGSDSTPREVRYSRPCKENGVDSQCFEPGHFPSLSTINPFADPALVDIQNELNEQLIPGGPVVQWTAPFSGTINLNVSAGVGVGSTGVLIELYRGDVLVPGAGWSVTTGGISQTFTGLEVDAGDTFYLRLATGADDGMLNGVPHDIVDSNLTATYTQSCVDASCSSWVPEVEGREPTGDSVFSFQSSQELHVNPVEPVIAPVKGILRFVGHIGKATSAADVRVCLQRIPAAAPNWDVGCDEPGAQNISGTQHYVQSWAFSTSFIYDTIPVEAGDAIVLRVESDYSIRPGAVTLVPSASIPPITYRSACIPNPSGTCTTTTDQDTLNGLPLNASSFAVFTAPAAPPEPVGAPPVPLVVPDELGDNAYFEIHAFARPIGGTDPIEVAIRSDQRGTMHVFDCTTMCTPPITYFRANGGESISIEVRAEPLSLPPTSASVPIWLDGGQPYDVPLIFRRKRAPQTTDTSFLVGGHRGWRATFWNETVPFTPEALLEQYDDLGSQSAAEQREMAITAIRPRPATYNLQQLAPFALFPSYVGPDSAAFVAQGGRLHAAKIGALPPTITGSGDPATADGGLFDGNYTRLSRTQSTYVSASATGLSGVIFNINLTGTVGKSETKTTTDLVDLTGDGIADVVTPHKVFAGTLSTSTGAELPGLTIANPPLLDHAFRRRTGLDYAITVGDGACATRGRTNSGGRTLRQDACDTVPRMGLFYDFTLGLGIGRSQTTDDLVDVNADGLPDIVSRRGGDIKVRYNLGTSYGELETLATLPASVTSFTLDDFEQNTERAHSALNSASDALEHDTTLTQHSTHTFNFGAVKFWRSGRITSSRSARKFVDINGDGLPDLLLKRQGQPIEVQYNRGADFGPIKQWSTPPWQFGAQTLSLSPSFDSKFDDFAIGGEHRVVAPEALTGTSSQSSTTYGGSIVVGASTVSFGGSLAHSHDVDTYELALMDVNGDGAADHVFRRGAIGSEFMYVKRSALTGRSNLLKKARLPLGGTFALEYSAAGNTTAMPHQRQVLSRLRINDGMAPPHAGPELVTEFVYEDGYYDRNEKEFFGFAVVKTVRANGVQQVQEFSNRNYFLRSRPTRELMQVATATAIEKLTERRIDYDVRPVLEASGVPIEHAQACSQALHPLLARAGTAAGNPHLACTPKLVVITEERDNTFEDGVSACSGTPPCWRRAVRHLGHDRFGYALAIDDTGDSEIASDELYTSLEYQHDTTRWILGRPTSITVRTAAGGSLLRRREGSYTSSGMLESLRIDTGSGDAETRFDYDPYGNLDHVTTPPNHQGHVQTYDLLFDQITNTYPTRITDGFGYSSTATYDPRFGVATNEIDTNGSQIARTLDSFGRLETVRGPYDSSAEPALQFRYFPAEAVPRAVTVTRAAAHPDYDGPSAAPMTGVSVVDGLGRPIQFRKSAVVHGVPGMTTSGIVERDAMGRATKAFHPFFTAGASTSVAAAPVGLHYTATEYDARDRPLVVRHPDQATDSFAYHIVAPPNGGGNLFLTTHTDAKQNRRETFTDFIGRTRVFIEHPVATTSSVTTYGYLATGDLQSIVDANGNITDLSYDLRGNRVFFDNPDTGSIQEGFDLMGNRIWKRTANDQALSAETVFHYERNRLARIEYPNKPKVQFVYGAPGATHGRAGRLSEIHDESGIVRHEYGAIGEVVRTTREIAPMDSTRPWIFTDLRFVYDSLGRVLQVHYPDGEVVKNLFDAGGMLSAIEGQGDGWQRPYVQDLQYDVFGNRTLMVLGNDVTTTWTYLPERMRLRRTTTALPTAEVVQDIEFVEYDPSGNPTWIRNTAQMGATDLRLAYDGVDRLLSATGTGSIDASTATTYSQQFEYTADHNISRKFRSHVVTTAGSSSAPEGTNFDLAYVYDASRPHLPKEVGSLAIQYDANGNPVERADMLTGRGQVLHWDSDNRLVEIEGDGVHQRYLYDSNGIRVRRTDCGTSATTCNERDTVFASPLYDVENGTEGIKHIFASELRVASVLTPYLGTEEPARPANAGTAYYFHGDHLGSTTVVTDEQGAVHQSLEYFVDGESWIDRAPQTPVNGYLFNGKPFDSATGFYDYGQRYYDPRTSLWLGTDPAFTESPGVGVGQPVMLAPSTYAAHSPLGYKDPDGRFPIPAVSLVRRLREETGASKVSNSWYWKVDRAVGRGAEKVVRANIEPIVDALGDPRAAARTLWGNRLKFLRDPVGTVADSVRTHADAVASTASSGADAVLTGDYEALTEMVSALATTVILASVTRGPSKAPTIRNYKLAGKRHPDTGVPFDKDGYPDFSAYRHPDVPDVRIKLSGSRKKDAALADSEAGISPDQRSGYVWHHHQEKGRMQLVKEHVHGRTGHTGGFSGK